MADNPMHSESAMKAEYVRAQRSVTRLLNTTAHHPGIIGRLTYAYMAEKALLKDLEEMLRKAKVR